MKNRIVISLLAGTLALGACNLDETPYGFYSEDNFFKTAADALFTRTTNETAIASKLRMRVKTSVKGIVLFSTFSKRSFDWVHENRIITNHINHLYRLYQD